MANSPLSAFADFAVRPSPAPRSLEPFFANDGRAGLEAQNR